MSDDTSADAVGAATVAEWVSKCTRYVLAPELEPVVTSSGANVYWAATCLINVARGHDYRDISLQLGYDWLEASVRENCVQALAEFNEAYPNGYGATKPVEENK